MDVKGRIKNSEGYYGYEYTRELIEEHLDALVAKIEADTCDPQVGWQVLGALVLHVGAEVPAAVREAIVKAAVGDAWANEDSEKRVAYMTDLSDKMQAHEPGKCVELPKEGLMEKIADRLEGRA